MLSFNQAIEELQIWILEEPSPSEEFLDNLEQVLKTKLGTACSEGMAPLAYVRIADIEGELKEMLTHLHEAITESLRGNAKIILLIHEDVVDLGTPEKLNCRHPLTVVLEQLNQYTDSTTAEMIQARVRIIMAATIDISTVKGLVDHLSKKTPLPIIPNDKSYVKIIQSPKHYVQAVKMPEFLATIGDTVRDFFIGMIVRPKSKMH